MKVIVPTALAVAAGFAFGWRAAAPTARDTMEPAVATNTPESFPVSSIHLQGDQVVLPASGFRTALRHAVTSGITMAQYGVTESPPPGGHTALTAELGLDDGQVATFHRIFREAAEARLAWEKDQVQVRDIAPGEWELNFPGDGGAAKRQLTGDLTEAFGAELTDRILLSADVDGLFEFASFGDGFRHGVLQVRSRVHRSDTFGEADLVHVAVQWGEEVQSFYLGERTVHPSGLPWRIARILGGEQVLRDGAAAR